MRGEILLRDVVVIGSTVPRTMNNDARVASANHKLRRRKESIIVKRGLDALEKEADGLTGVASGLSSCRLSTKLA